MKVKKLILAGILVSAIFATSISSIASFTIETTSNEEAVVDNTADISDASPEADNNDISFEDESNNADNESSLESNSENTDSSLNSTADNSDTSFPDAEDYSIKEDDLENIADDYIPEEVQEAIDTDSQNEITDVPVYNGVLKDQILRSKINGKTVTVEGSLPEGASLSLSELSSEDTLFYIRKTIDGLTESADGSSAIDITILDSDGNEFEPDNDTVKVTISADEIEAADNNEVKLYHVTDEAKISSTAMPAEEIEADVSNDTIAFEADSFSVYVYTLTGDNKKADPNSSTADTYIIRTTALDGTYYYIGYNGSARKECMRTGKTWNVNKNMSVVKSVVVHSSTDGSFLSKDIWTIFKSVDNLSTDGTYYALYNLFSEGSLYGEGIDNATRGLQLYEYSNITGFYWQILANDDGTYTFVNKDQTASKGYTAVLDIHGGADSVANNQYCQIHKSNGSWAQKFEIYKAKKNTSSNLVSSSSNISTSYEELSDNTLNIANSKNSAELDQNNVHTLVDGKGQGGLEINYHTNSSVSTDDLSVEIVENSEGDDPQIGTAKNPSRWGSVTGTSGNTYSFDEFSESDGRRPNRLLSTKYTNSLGSENLPFWKIKLSIDKDETLRKNRYVTITYPIVGTYTDPDGYEITIGATVKYYNFTIADDVSMLTSGLAMDEELSIDGDAYLYVSPDLYSGAWNYKISSYNTEVTFYKFEDYNKETGWFGENYLDNALHLENAYLTFNSLNQGNLKMLCLTSGQEDFFSEFVGPLNADGTSKAGTVGYVSGKNGSSSNTAGDGQNVTNIRAKTITLTSIFDQSSSQDYGTYDVFLGTNIDKAGWGDNYGTDFKRNSVSIMLDGTTNYFIIGCTRASSWFSFSSINTTKAIPERYTPEVTKEIVETIPGIDSIDGISYPAIYGNLADKKNSKVSSDISNYDSEDDCTEGSYDLINDYASVIPASTDDAAKESGTSIIFKLWTKVPLLNVNILEKPLSYTITDTFENGIIPLPVDKWGYNSSYWSADLTTTSEGLYQATFTYTGDYTEGSGLSSDFYIPCKQSPGFLIEEKNIDNYCVGTIVTSEGTNSTKSNNVRIVPTEGVIEINKTDEEGNPLDGAVFALKKEDGTFVTKENDAEETVTYTVTTNTEGKAKWSGIEDGTYTIVEISSPSGYKKAADVTVTVKNTKQDRKIIIEDAAATLNATIEKSVNSPSHMTGTLEDKETWRVISTLKADDQDVTSVKISDELDSHLVYDDTYTLVITDDENAESLFVKGDDYICTVNDTDAGNEKLILEFTANGIKKINDMLAKSTTVSVVLSFDTYIALSEDNAEEVIGKEIPNKAILTVSTESGLTKDIPSNEAAVYTGKLNIEKIDEKTGNGLSGVEFALYTKRDGSYYPVKTVTSDKTISYATYGNDVYESVAENFVTVTTDSEGKASIMGLADGDYYLKETKTVSGYSLLMRYIKMNIKDGKGSISVKNGPVISILDAGGNGYSPWPILLGIVLIATGVFVMLCKQREA